MTARKILVTGGSGFIGSALVKRLVQMHGGSIEVRSVGEGQGSEFLVRLPRIEEPQPRLMTREPTAVQEPAHARRILVVDDNQDSATSLAMLLRIQGHETYLAHDGAEALEKIETLRPGFVLLDIGLPKLNGYEVCRRLRQQPWGKDIVLIALTGWGQDEDRLKSQQAGFDGHLVKPVDHTALAQLLASPPPRRELAV